VGGYRPHPIGAYGELLILNHPLFTQRRLSTIRKISFQPSLLCNRTTALGHLKKLVSFYGFYVPELELTFPKAKIVTVVSLFHVKQINKDSPRFSYVVDPKIF